MANPKLYIGSDVGSYKIGADDCHIYLGDELMYPISQPTVGTYLTFEAIDNCVFSLSGHSCSYSLDDGDTWTTLASNTDSPTVPAGKTIMFKSTGAQFGTSDGCGTFSSTGRFKAYGNVMSMAWGDDFSGQTGFSGKTHIFDSMFRNCTGLTDAGDMLLPATTLTNYCYYRMFAGCTSLTSAPSVLPATTLADNCYESMYYGCTSLNSPSEIQAITLASGCCANMFQNCSSLETAPTLGASTIQRSCYANMFGNCTSLVAAPALPATTLANNCYGGMFTGCTSLTTAPDLPAKTLTDSCYRNMFSGCTRLNSITCLATNISASNCTTNWVNSVAATGTFHPDPSMASTWTRGVDGIPIGWIIDAPTDYSKNYLTVEALNNYVSVSYSGKGTGLVSYSINNGTTWTTWPNSGGTTGLNSGQKLMLKATKTPATNVGIGTIKITSGAPSGQPTPKAKIYGNPLSLLYGDNFTGHTGTIPNSAFHSLFYGSKNLTDASNLALPTMTLSQGCYSTMFVDCIRLTSAPVLSATTLAADCYIQMFEGCTSLTSVKCLATNISASNCTAHWLNGVAANGTFTKATSMSSWTTGENGIPSGWTVQNA